MKSESGIGKEALVSGKLKFTVDSSLLRELGERLIGKPFIALAELVKNSYDADATWIRIDLDLAKSVIVVSDNGQGMTFGEFQDFWMRVGSTHKRKQRVSRRLGRPMTGYKGVGRLAVQFLSKKLEIRTTSEQNLKTRLTARVSWEEAVTAGKLTEASVEYELETSGEGFAKGTTLILSELKQDWTPDRVQDLASEIWQLQPPYSISPITPEQEKETFRILLRSQAKEIETSFKQRLSAIEDIWHARVEGKNDNGTVTLALTFAGESEPKVIRYTIPDCVLRNGEFDVKIYLLTRRQPQGIKVGEARDYLSRFGGVHVYDAGFHLPYYGGSSNDWLGIEVDHSHRLSLSKLLPTELQVQEGLSFLPTNSRLLGLVRVETIKEPSLNIVITRDKFQDGPALNNLVYMVRWALDFYSMEEAKRNLAEAAEGQEIAPAKFLKIQDVLTKYKSELTESQYIRIEKDLREVSAQVESEAETMAKRVGLMGSLATAGISTVATQHELRQQFEKVDNVIRRLDKIRVEDPSTQKEITELREELSRWVARAKATNALFSFLQDPQNAESRERYRLGRMVEAVTSQVASFARSTRITNEGLNGELLLPKGSLAEWSSIFQNVLFNAFNATSDSQVKRVNFSSQVRGGNRTVLVQDTGVGMDLSRAEKFFEPFVREVKVSPERQALGYGGTGLGLTIVRMIATNLGCQVGFVPPGKGYKTAFALRWSESYD
ncbi:MAG: ATP-binding protein [Thaumarchaeota archaeon]|nr:ATP-binding protein [Nitrososphaerota archaeon]